MTSRFLVAVAVLAGAAVPMLPIADAPTASAVTCTVTVRLKPGTTATPVRCLEQRLRQLGFATGPIDRFYDPTSVASVKRFQASRGLYADGLVTSITGRQLGLRGALPPAGSTKVTVLGDSTSAAMRWYDEARNETTIYDIMGRTYDLAWSVESCKRLWARSCYGRVDPGTGLRWTPRSVLPEMQTTLKGRLGDAVVIMAGYDDYPSIADEIDAIVGEAERQGVARVFWLTYRTSSTYSYGAFYRQHNSALMAAKTRHPNLVVLDWNAYTHQQTAARQDAWFERDDIHMTRAGALALATYLKAAIDASDARACTQSRALSGTPSATMGVPAAPPGVTSGYHPIAPTRVFDSRTSGTGKVGAGRFIDVDLSAVVPADATNVALTVTAFGPCGRGHVTVYACGVRPNTSSMNYEGGRSTGGSAISLMTSRRVCIWTNTATDLTVDVTGWFGPNGDLFHTIDVRRWLDTRTGSAAVPTVGTIASGSQIRLPIAGSFGPIPAGATAAWLNVTAVSTGARGSLIVYPGPCSTRPNATSTQVFTGRAAGNAVLSKLGPDGSVCIASVGSTVHAVVDVSGWFDGNTAGGLRYRATTPARLLDTRSGTLPGPGSTIRIDRTDVPVMNITSALATNFGFVSAKPCGVTLPSSVLNTAKHENVANLAAVEPGFGAVCLSPSIATHLVVDLLGSFVPAAG